MTDVATVMRTELEALGPTNRIARQLVNRLELAEDTRAEAEVISDELDEIWQMIADLTVRTADAFERGIARLEDEGNLAERAPLVVALADERDRRRAVVDAAREFDAVLARSGSGVGGEFYDPLLRLRHALGQLDRRDANEGAGRSQPPRG